MEYEAARELQKKLVKKLPVPDYMHGLAKTHTNLGLLLLDLGQHHKPQEPSSRQL